MRVGLEQEFSLHGAGQNIWIAKGETLTRYDWNNGSVAKQVTLTNGFNAQITDGLHQFNDHGLSRFLQVSVEHLSGKRAVDQTQGAHEVTLHVGGVHGPQPAPEDLTNHLVLLVSGLPSSENPEGRWYVDAGLGDAIHEPLPLVPGTYPQGPHTFVLTAALPRLTHRRALTLSLTGSAVSNLVPMGGALGIGLNYWMTRHWGFSKPAFTSPVIVSSTTFLPSTGLKGL